MQPQGADLAALIAQKTPEQKRRILALLREKRNRQAQRLFHAIYPDADAQWGGPAIIKGLIQPGQTLHARDKYPKHMEFFAAGATHRERCAMCANRVGKTFGMGGFEMAAHLTGLYPPWWEGRRFTHPISAWAAGKKYETTRDIVQSNLLGEVRNRGARKVLDGRAMVPGHLIGDPTWKQGVQNLVDTVPIRHASGGWSLLGMKAYEQGRGAFEGEGKHVVWCDEEPDEDVYGEILIRTATTRGIVMITFTPLEGMSKVVLQFLPQEMRPDGA